MKYFLPKRNFMEMYFHFETSLSYGDTNLCEFVNDNWTRSLIPDNYETVKKIFNSMQQRFKKDPELFRRYNDVMMDYIYKGIVEVIDDVDVETGTKMNHH